MTKFSEKEHEAIIKFMQWAIKNYSKIEEVIEIKEKKENKGEIE